jgi:hypothetical protein
MQQGRCQCIGGGKCARQCRPLAGSKGYRKFCCRLCKLTACRDHDADCLGHKRQPARAPANHLVPLRAPACQGDVEAQEHSAADADYIEDEAMPDCPVPSQSDLAMRAPCNTPKLPSAPATPHRHLDLGTLFKLGSGCAADGRSHSAPRRT